MVLGTLGDESVKNRVERLTPFQSELAAEKKDVDHGQSSGHH